MQKYTTIYRKYKCGNTNVGSVNICTKKQKDPPTVGAKACAPHMFWQPFFLHAAAAAIRAGAALFFYSFFLKPTQARELTPKAAALLLVGFKKNG